MARQVDGQAGRFPLGLPRESSWSDDTRDVAVVEPDRCVDFLGGLVADGLALAFAPGDNANAALLRDEIRTAVTGLGRLANLRRRLRPTPH